MAHDPDFDLTLDPLNTAFLGEDLSDVSSLPESINYQLNDTDPAIESAKALLANAKQKLMRYTLTLENGIGKKDSVSNKQKKLARLTHEVQKAELCLDALINS